MLEILDDFPFVLVMTFKSSCPPYEPDLDNMKVQCTEVIFIRKETSPTLNRDGRELSKNYDSLLETPRTTQGSRTPPTASSRSGSISRNSATIR